MGKTKYLLFTTESEGAVGLLLIWHHKLIYIALTLYKHACKVDCDVKATVESLPFWLCCEQKMLGVLQVLKHIKWEDSLEEGKKTFALHFEQVQRFILVQKIFWALRHLNNALLIQKAHWQEIREATMCSKFNSDISLKHEIWY